MNHAARLLLAALVFIVALCVVSVSVETQDRGRGPLRLVSTNTRDVRDSDRMLERLQRGRELRVRRTQADTMLSGRVHERLDQYYKGVPVFGGDVVRQVRDGSTVSVFGTLYQGIDLDVVPKLTEADAVAVFEREAGQSASPETRPELWILPKEDGFRLVYRISEFTGHEVPVVFVNAVTGAVEGRYNNLQTQSPAVGTGTGVLGDSKKVSSASYSSAYYTSDMMRPPALGTFDLRGNFDRAYSILSYGLVPGWSDMATSSNNTWTDSCAVDAHVYLGWTYDYYYKRFGRKGLDGNDQPVRAIIHPLGPTHPYYNTDLYYTYVVNAFWCPTCGPDRRGYMVFGDGNRAGYYDASSGCAYKCFGGALDIAAHELTHAVTTYTSNLVYQGESGALNEAFSDIMGTSVEFYYQQAGSGPLKAEYAIGEDITTPVKSGALPADRSLSDPLAFGRPDHFSLFKTGPYDANHDYGYVHYNSTIAGQAFYLAIEGGRNRTSGQTVQGVGGVNREQVEKVFYRAFTYYLTSNSNFSGARAATIRAAQELYGSGSAADRAITQAWSAVGVF